jgi:hypothetical protein
MLNFFRYQTVLLRDAFEAKQTPRSLALRFAKTSNSFVIIQPEDCNIANLRTQILKRKKIDSTETKENHCNGNAMAAWYMAS